MGMGMGVAGKPRDRVYDIIGIGTAFHETGVERR